MKLKLQFTIVICSKCKDLPLHHEGSSNLIFLAKVLVRPPIKMLSGFHRRRNPALLPRACLMVAVGQDGQTIIQLEYEGGRKIVQPNILTFAPSRAFDHRIASGVYISLHP